MNETQSPVHDKADGLVYQKLSGNKLAYWSYDPMCLNCGATGERRVDVIDESTIDADDDDTFPDQSAK